MTLLSRFYFWWTVLDARLYLKFVIWRVDRQIQKIHKVQAKLAGLKGTPTRRRETAAFALQDTLDVLELLRYEMVCRLQMLDQEVEGSNPKG